MNLRIFLNKALVLLMIIHAVIASTFFSFIQHITEGLILSIVSFLIFKNKLHLRELLLIFVFIFAQAGSIMINPVPVFLLNAKQFGMAILCLICFRIYSPHSVSIQVLFLTNILLYVLQIMLGRFPLPFESFLVYGTEEHMTSRPLGVLFNAHASAFFLATYFLGSSLTRWYFFIDFFFLYQTGIMTSFLSYIAQRMIHITGKFIPIFRSLQVQILLLVIITLTIGVATTFLLEFFNFFGKMNSAIVIFEQLTDPQAYLPILHIFPHDVVKYTTEFVWQFPQLKIDVGNEIAFIAFIIQGGVILMFMYFYCLFSTVPHFAFFILVSMIHYSYPLLPLNIYTMCMFEKIYQKHKMSQENRLL